LVAASLPLSLWHFGPLAGSVAALLLTLAGQLYLPGFLLARALGRTTGYPAVRFAWTLLYGLSLTIVLGTVFRLLNIPAAVYVVVLHGIMLALTLLPDSSPPDSPGGKLTRAALPYYLLLAFSCLVALGVTYESRYRFFGFEDQAVFISQADWLANNPGDLINDMPLRSRQVGVLRGDTRNDTDGWTYNQAAWVWASGVPASQLIWYDLDPLFVWAVQLLFLALAYHLTGRESAGAWSAAAVTLAGLLTFDNLAYNPAYSSFGRFALFEVSTLRQFSITIMLPLGLLAGLSYLQSAARRDLFLTLLAGVALAILHPFQATLFAISLLAAAGLHGLAQFHRKNILKLLPLVVVVVFVMALPVVQRFNRSGLQAVDTFVRNDGLSDTPQTAAYGFLLLENVPVVGSTYIMQPETVFYHPIIALAVGLGLLFGLRWRRQLDAQYIFGVTVAGLLIFFVPGITETYVKIASWVGILTTVFILPVALVFGLSFDALFQWLIARRPHWESRLAAGVALVAALVVGLLLYEPLPLAASPRDQINAYNEIQAMRRVRPEQEALIAHLRAVLPPDTRAVILSPYETANIIIEDISNTLTTGGRASRNLAAPGDNRFLTLSDPPAPWLDSADLAYLREWGVTHIVLRGDDTRLPQLLLQPERFPFLGDAAGYVVFSVVPAQLEPSPVDDLFAAMNAAYAEGTAPYRWGRDGFNLVLPGSPERWDALAAAWDAGTDSDLTRLGLALAATLAGDDTLALPEWQALYDQRPAVSLYADGAATTTQYMTPGAASIAPLLANLDSPDATTRVLAARSLLTWTFFYLLSPEQLDRVIAITAVEPVIWGHLADFDQPDALRKRVSLLMNAGRWETARAWLALLPAIETSPQDMNAAAALLLVQGDVDGALDYLQPTTDADWLTGKRYWHPDRWETGKNLPQQTYYLLLAEQARRAGQWAEAESAYQQAIAAGADTAGRYFLAGMWLESGNTAAGEALLAEVTADWEAAHDAPMPELVPLLALADTGALYAMQPTVTRETEDMLTVWATYGGVKPHGSAYPVQDWRIEVANPADGALLAQADTPAQFVDGALVRLPVEITLETADVPELTPALVVIQPRYDNAITAGEVFASVVLNRPDAAAIPPGATPAGLRFGEHITLDAYELADNDRGITVTLYWETDAAPDGDYQVFVHVVDGDGVTVAQQDSTPVDNRYPTSQWRVGTVIADTHTLNLDAPLPPGNYRVYAGLYRLPDAVRLPVAPAGEQVENDAALLGTLER
jgi:tetratricopeptide (TPR) repeat protein